MLSLTADKRSGVYRQTFSDVEIDNVLDHIKSLDIHNDDYAGRYGLQAVISSMFGIVKKVDLDRNGALEKLKAKVLPLLQKFPLPVLEVDTLTEYLPYRVNLSLLSLYMDLEDEDLQNAILYTTLAYSQSSQEILMKTEAGCGILAYNMGSMFRNAFTDHYKAFPNLSKLQLIFRAKHYFEEAAMMGFENAFFYLAATLLDLATFEDRTPSVLTYTYYAPRILFWCRKGAKVKRTKSQATEMIKDLEKVWKQSCASCWKRADPNNDSFKRCARCKSAWYCSKECQVKHWASHKSDCLGKAPATIQKRGGS